MENYKGSCVPLSESPYSTRRKRGTSARGGGRRASGQAAIGVRARGRAKGNYPFPGQHVQMDLRVVSARRSALLPRVCAIADMRAQCKVGPSRLRLGAEMRPLNRRAAAWQRWQQAQGTGQTTRTTLTGFQASTDRWTVDDLPTLEGPGRARPGPPVADPAVLRPLGAVAGSAQTPVRPAAGQPSPFDALEGRPRELKRAFQLCGVPRARGALGWRHNAALSHRASRRMCRASKPGSKASKQTNMNCSRPVQD